MTRARSTRAGAAVAALVLALAPWSHAIAQPAETIDGIAHDFYRLSWQRDPGNATGTGIHDYDDSLGTYDAPAIAKRLADDDAFLKRIAALDTASLSPDDALDAKLLANTLHDDVLQYGEQEQWRHNPDQYVNVASGDVYAVIERPYAPAAVQARHVIARERAIPKLFADAERSLTTVDATTAKLAYDDAVGSEDFFTTTVPQALGTLSDPALRAQLASADRVARAAMVQYAGWLKAHPLAHPSGTYAIGEKFFTEKLKYEEGLDITVPAYEAIGRKALADTKARYLATARAIDASKPPQAVADEISKKHPTAAQLLPAAQHDLIALREFIVSHHILTLPADADIKVVPTPVFQRATTFASMDAPGALEKNVTRAYYNVTPVDTTMPAAQQEQLLRFYNDYWRPIISAHEVYPGHFVNYIIDKHLPLSLVRKLTWSSSFGEGWAHYSEQMMVDEGWGGGDPKVRLGQLGGALIRECRYLVGVGEHTGGMSVEDGTKFFMQNAFMSRAAASKEALRGTQDPTYGYYTFGKLEILKLRADMQKKMGADFTLQKFHDALLAHGDPPIPLLRPMLLGDADDGKVL